MYYECPVCKSKKKPKTVKYYPLVVGCRELTCKKTGREEEFIKRGQSTNFTPIPQYH